MEHCVHIYAGDGKGKTTAAAGLALRAAGQGKKVVFAQYMKGGESGEITAFTYIPNVTVIRNNRAFPFFHLLDEKGRAELQEDNDRITREVLYSGADLVILDEVIDAINLGAVDPLPIMEFLQKKSCETVLTGRNPSEELIAVSDYYTEMKKVKHPYDKGKKARKGIEF